MFHAASVRLEKLKGFANASLMLNNFVSNDNSKRREGVSQTCEPRLDPMLLYHWQFHERGFTKVRTPYYGAEQIG